MVDRLIETLFRRFLHGFLRRLLRFSTIPSSMANRVNHWKSLWYNKRRKHYLFLSVSVAVVVGVVQPLLVNRVYSEAQLVDLLEGLKNASLYFGSAVATASATILALMLTLLSMTHQADKTFKRTTYQGIQLIGFVSTVTFIISILLLLCLSLPIGEFNNISANWFKAFYYTITVLNGVMSGLMIFGVLTLFEIIRDVIHKIAPERRDSDV